MLYLLDSCFERLIVTYTSTRVYPKLSLSVICSEPLAHSLGNALKHRHPSYTCTNKIRRARIAVWLSYTNQEKQAARTKSRGSCYSSQLVAFAGDRMQVHNSLHSLVIECKFTICCIRSLSNANSCNNCADLQTSRTV